MCIPIVSERKGTLLGVDFPSMSPLSAGLTGKKWSFVLEYLLKNTCIAIILERGNSVSLWSKGKACFLPIVRDLIFLSLGFLFYNPLCEPTSIWVQSLTSMGLGEKESSHKYDDVYALCCTKVVKFFVSHPKVSYFLKISIKPVG